MDADTDDLIAQLCTRIGMLMEDVSAIALAAGAPKATDRLDGITELRQVISKIDALIGAAVALMD